MYDACFLVTLKKTQIDILELERINRRNINSKQILKFHRIFPFFLLFFVLPSFVEINFTDFCKFYRRLFFVTLGSDPRTIKCYGQGPTLERNDDEIGK